MNGITGYYQGVSAHFMRNFLGGGFHLGTFEYLRLKFANSRNIPVTELPFTLTMFSASVGGILFWSLTFPFDVTKSALQGDNPLKEKRKYSSMLDCMRKLYAEGGYPRFFKVFTPCMLRAIPANSILLLTSSYLSEHL
jgi:solute carrier family 25 carnitine/acylcarnitine transporter 20/29